MVKRLVSGMLLAFVLSSCGDDGSGSNPVEPVSEMTSSSSVITEPESSSDKEASSIKESSSSKAKSSTSKDVKPAKMSSSSKVKEASSSSKGSSNSAESSNDVGESSSSAKDSSSSSEEKESSSSNVKTSSSSAKSSSSSAKSSSSSVKSSSSSAKSSSSSAVIPSKLYDCETYKCVSTKYLNPEIEYGEYLDVRDSQVYRTVQIGEQVWMAQNLNYDTTETLCFSNDTSNCSKMGRLYNWETALSACPPSWHLPDTTEFDDLTNYVQENGNGLESGKSLKSGKNNLFGFSGIVGCGYAADETYFAYGGNSGTTWLWTANVFTKNSNYPPERYATVRSLSNQSSLFGISFELKKYYVSVRCIKD